MRRWAYGLGHIALGLGGNRSFVILHAIGAVAPVIGDEWDVAAITNDDQIRHCILLGGEDTGVIAIPDKPIVGELLVNDLCLCGQQT
jgi:hypothetical protein